jgi:tRNA(fMet)-specific endonuclease VapC
MYLLDTNSCIFIKNKKPENVLERLHSVIKEKVYISSITIAELQYGIYNSSYIEKNRISLAEFLAPFEVLNFDDSDAEKYGIIRANLAKTGKIIGPYYMLIAAQALEKDLILVTNNVKEFKRVKGLKIEDWKSK